MIDSQAGSQSDSKTDSLPVRTDADFLAAFRACTLPKPEWTHAAHVRMAWLTLRELPFAEALAAIREGIRRYNHSLANLTGYHETLTRVYAILVANRMRISPDHVNWDDFARAHPDLLDLKAPPTARHYRRETILSAEARARFVEPDLAPLPEVE